MANKRTTKRGTVLAALPKRVQRVQAEAEKALNQGYKATLNLLPAGPRKAVRELGSQLDDAATKLRANGRKVLHTVERRGEAVADRVEKAVAGAEKRGERAVRRFERESAKWLEAFESGARRALRAVVDQLDLASARDVAQLSRRVGALERKRPTRKRAA